MKIDRVSINNRRKEFSITTRSGTAYTFPYAESDPRPVSGNQIKEVFVDKELGNEAITYVLNFGDEGSIHMEQILEYNEDPRYMAELLTYKLTLEARHGIENSGLSRRQIAKRLQTSVPQLYRLLDPANTRKSINQLVALLHVLNCKVDLVVNCKTDERTHREPAHQ
jgi:predicted XRE-type DNA-binding protein